MLKRTANRELLLLLALFSFTGFAQAETQLIQSG